MSHHESVMPHHVPPPGPERPGPVIPEPTRAEVQSYLGDLTAEEVALIVHHREWTHHAPTCPLCRRGWKP